MKVALGPSRFLAVGSAGFAESGTLATERRKFGVVLGPDVKTGIDSPLNVGALVGAGARVPPGSVVDAWVLAGAAVAWIPCAGAREDAHIDGRRAGRRAPL